MGRSRTNGPFSHEALSYPGVEHAALLGSETAFPGQVSPPSFSNIAILPLVSPMYVLGRHGRKNAPDLLAACGGWSLTITRDSQPGAFRMSSPHGQLAGNQVS